MAAYILYTRVRPCRETIKINPSLYGGGLVLIWRTRRKRYVKLTAAPVNFVCKLSGTS